MAEQNGRKRSIDERIDALTMNLELMSHTVEAQREAAENRGREQDRRLDRIMDLVEKLTALAERHENRVAKLEGTE